VEGRGSGPGPFRYHLELTPAQLALTYRALRKLHDSLPPAEAGLRELLAEVLAKLPGEDAIRAIPLEQAGEAPVLELAEPDRDEEDEPPPTVA
jgi:hypothetical protein